jgi:hypothetical protein
MGTTLKTMSSPPANVCATRRKSFIYCGLRGRFVGDMTEQFPCQRFPCRRTRRETRKIEAMRSGESFRLDVGYTIELQQIENIFYK